MTSKEERACIAFLDQVHGHGGRHVKRLGPAVGPIVWKISRLPRVQWWRRRTRQMGFRYRGRYFKGRYSHAGRGRLEIVEVLGTLDRSVALMVAGLDEAMRVELKQRLDRFIKRRPKP